MYNKTKQIISLSLAPIFLGTLASSFVFATACKEEGNKTVTVQTELSTNGTTQTETTTSLFLEVSEQVNGLALSDIAVVNTTNQSMNISVTSLSYDALVYTLNVTGEWYNNDVVQLTVTKSGYVFDPVSLTTNVYANTHVFFHSLEANGQTGIENTTHLTLTTTAASGKMFLTAQNFTITNKTDATRSLTITGLETTSAHTYVLTIGGSWLNGDEVEVNIVTSHYQLDGANVSAHVYKDTRTQVQISNVQPNGEDTNSLTTQISFQADNLHIVKDDVTLTNITDASRTITIGSLSETNTAGGITTYDASVTGTFLNGDEVRMQIAKDNYNFNPNHGIYEFSVFRIVATLSTLQADGDSEDSDTTNLTLTTDKPIGTLLASEVIILDASTEQEDTTVGVTGDITVVDNIYTIPVSGTWGNGHNIKLQINKPEVQITNTLGTTLHKDTTAHSRLESATTDAQSGMSVSTSIYVIVSNLITDLTISDIYVVNGSKANTSIAISELRIYSEAKTYHFNISGEWDNGDIAVITFSKEDYTIENNNITASLCTVVVDVEAPEANGTPASLNTTNVTVWLVYPDVRLPLNLTSSEIDFGSDKVVVGTVSEPTLTSENRYSYIIAISGTWLNGDSFNLSIKVHGYNFIGDTEVTLNKNIVQVAQLEANGGAYETKTDKLTLAFNKEVPFETLTKENFSIVVGDGTNLNYYMTVSQISENSVHVVELFVDGAWPAQITIHLTVTNNLYQFTYLLAGQNSIDAEVFNL